MVPWAVPDPARQAARRSSWGRALILGSSASWQPVRLNGLVKRAGRRAASIGEPRAAGESAAGAAHQPSTGLLFCLERGQASAAEITSPSLPFSLPALLAGVSCGLPSLEPGKGPSSGPSWPLHKAGVPCPQKGTGRIESHSALPVES